MTFGHSAVPIWTVTSPCPWGIVSRILAVANKLEVSHLTRINRIYCKYNLCIWLRVFFIFNRSSSICNQFSCKMVVLPVIKILPLDFIVTFLYFSPPLGRVTVWFSTTTSSVRFAISAGVWADAILIMAVVYNRTNFSMNAPLGRF